MALNQTILFWLTLIIAVGVSSYSFTLELESPNNLLTYSLPFTNAMLFLIAGWVGFSGIFLPFKEVLDFIIGLIVFLIFIGIGYINFKKFLDIQKMA